MLLEPTGATPRARRPRGLAAGPLELQTELGRRWCHPYTLRLSRSIKREPGRMAERFKAPVLKTGVAATSP